jgi:hypothetical protein
MEDRFARIERKLFILKLMVAANLVGVLVLLCQDSA